MILKNIQKWEPEGFIGVVNREIIRAIIASLRNRGGLISLTQLANNTLEIGYTVAKNLAKTGAKKELYDKLNLEINPNFNLSGVQLMNMTQALAYRRICKIKKKYCERSRMTRTITIT